MVAKSEINLFNRVKILTLKEEGFSQREIAASSVQKWSSENYYKIFKDWRSG